MKKTFKVKELIAQTNQRNRGSTCSPEVRQGWNFVAEYILHECDCYEGFRYLSQNEVPKDNKPGIRMGPGGKALPHGERFNDTDDTRIEFYLHHKLAE